MKKFFLSIASVALLSFATSCSSDDFNLQESTILTKENEIENLQFTKGNDSINSFSEKSLVSCNAEFYGAHPSFDNSFQFNEPIVISWQSLLCGEPAPSFIIFFLGK
jgi:hypothetical protein